jgi:cleavage stimulation factor subunit 3
MARQTAGANGSLTRTETQLSILSNNSNQPLTSITTTAKRPPSPDHRKREEPRPPGDYGPPAHKRPRPMSPPRDRERWDGPPRRRFLSPPPWERDRDRDGPPPPPPRRLERDREEEKPTTIPSIISWFVGQLPAPAVFDGMSRPPSAVTNRCSSRRYAGPVFRTDDLMMLLRNAVIPSSGASRARSPPPAPGPSSRG